MASQVIQDKISRLTNVTRGLTTPKLQTQGFTKAGAQLILGPHAGRVAPGVNVSASALASSFGSSASTSNFRSSV
jgi:hypothetical protein